MHVLEELYQHLGQMELTRDLVVAGIVSDDCGPIACSLDAEEFTERVGEWRALVAVVGPTRSRSDATTVRLVLDGAGRLRCSGPPRWVSARRRVAPSSTSRSTWRPTPAR